ncbi:MAG: DUF1559 domain-containing protein, partial [Planctomycetes bacterium]|nr:DUF1559 domain-containing protein [Planctomycetota bacterium]
MNVVAGPNPLEMILMLLLGGGFGMPAGVPPTQEDGLSARVAPADCLLYVSWFGTGVPDATSGNQTEQLLAEPEVQTFLKQSRSNLLDMLRQASADDPGGQQRMDELSRILELVQGKPGAFYLDELSFHGNDPPTIKGGGLLRMDDDAAEIKSILDKLAQSAPDGQVTSVQLGGRTFSRIVLDEDAPPITWGLAGTYLVVGLGDGSLEKLMQRAGGQPPDWLRDVRTKLAVPRVSSTIYVDVKRLVQIAVQQSETPEAGRVLSVLGLDKVQSYSMVSGMDDTGCVSRVMLSIEGAGSGLLSWIDAKPLRGEDLAVIGQDAPAAVVFRLDSSRLLDLWLDLAGKIEPRAAEEMNQGLAEFERQLGINLREDVLKSLGDTWRIFAQPGPAALINGWTVAIGVSDRKRLEPVLDKLVKMATSSLQQAGPGAPSIQSSTVDGHNVYTLAFNQPAVPFSPSWCLTDDNFFITATPQHMKPVLAGGSGTSLAQRPELQALFSANATTLGMVYLDTQEIAQTLVPMLPGMIQAMGPMGPSLDTTNLPSADVVTRHLQPTLAAVRRTSDGVELVCRQTLPGANLGAAAPVGVAMALPAISAAREAARRAQSMNNMKQIALAMHNFHDTYRAFPAGYSADADGKPLLSWRVHILPSLGHQELFDQ